jgi:paraquat-inducible protein B
MSKKSNPVAIGSFVIGAIVLVVIGVMVFSSGKLFTTTHTVVAVFPGTVKGLQVGNPVEFRGVRIGSVKAIKILYDRKSKSVVLPVYLEIVSGSMISSDFKQLKPIKSDEEWYAEIEGMIKNGLKAQLEMQSLVTGQMVVAIDFHPDTPARQVQVDKRYLEIPTMPSTINRLMGRLQKIPLDKLAEKAIKVLDDLDSVANSPDLKSMLDNASLAARDAHKLLAGISAQVQPLSDSAQATLDEARQAVTTIEKQLDQTLDDISTLSRNVDREIQPLSKSAVSALKEARAAFESVDGLIGKNSVTRSDLDSTLQEFAGAARSLRILADYLEQHPDALLKGKGY